MRQVVGDFVIFLNLNTVVRAIKGLLWNQNKGLSSAFTHGITHRFFMFSLLLLPCTVYCGDCRTACRSLSDSLLFWCSGIKYWQVMETQVLVVFPHCKNLLLLSYPGGETVVKKTVYVQKIKLIVYLRQTTVLSCISKMMRTFCFLCKWSQRLHVGFSKRWPCFFFKFRLM